MAPLGSRTPVPLRNPELQAAAVHGGVVVAKGQAPREAKGWSLQRLRKQNWTFYPKLQPFRQKKNKKFGPLTSFGVGLSILVRLPGFSSPGRAPPKARGPGLPAQRGSRSAGNLGIS